MQKLLSSMGLRHGTGKAFSDFVEFSALSVSNSVDLRMREEREARYMQMVQGYRPDEMNAMAECLGLLVMALEGPPIADVLGPLFHDLELHNEYAGQFFTPQGISTFMGKMTVDPDSVQAIVQERCFMTVCEPAVGSGGMVIGMAQALRDAGINYQEAMHVMAVDIDSRCVHMAYLQLALLGIPAVVVHGDTISMKEWSHWYTPAHILGLWSHKLRRRQEADAPQDHREPVEVLALPPMPPPTVQVPVQLGLW